MIHDRCGKELDVIVVALGNSPFGNKGSVLGKMCMGCMRGDSPKLDPSKQTYHLIDHKAKHFPEYLVSLDCVCDTCKGGKDGQE